METFFKYETSLASNFKYLASMLHSTTFRKARSQALQAIHILRQFSFVEFTKQQLYTVLLNYLSAFLSLHRYAQFHEHSPKKAPQLLGTAFETLDKHIESQTWEPINRTHILGGSRAEPIFLPLQLVRKTQNKAVDTQFIQQMQTTEEDRQPSVRESSCQQQVQQVKVSLVQMNENIDSYSQKLLSILQLGRASRNWEQLQVVQVDQIISEYELSVQRKLHQIEERLRAFLLAHRAHFRREHNKLGQLEVHCESLQSLLLRQKQQLVKEQTETVNHQQRQEVAKRKDFEYTVSKLEIELKKKEEHAHNRLQTLHLEIEGFIAERSRSQASLRELREQNRSLEQFCSKVRPVVTLLEDRLNHNVALLMRAFGKFRVLESAARTMKARLQYFQTDRLKQLFESEVSNNSYFSKTLRAIFIRFSSAVVDRLHDSLPQVTERHDCGLVRLEFQKRCVPGCDFEGSTTAEVELSAIDKLLEKDTVLLGGSLLSQDFQDYLQSLEKHIYRESSQSDSQGKDKDNSQEEREKEKKKVKLSQGNRQMDEAESRKNSRRIEKVRHNVLRKSINRRKNTFEERIEEVASEMSSRSRTQLLQAKHKKQDSDFSQIREEDEQCHAAESEGQGLRHSEGEGGREREREIEQRRRIQQSCSEDEQQEQGQKQFKAIRHKLRQKDLLLTPSQNQNSVSSNSSNFRMSNKSKKAGLSRDRPQLRDSHTQCSVLGLGLRLEAGVQTEGSQFKFSQINYDRFLNKMASHFNHKHNRTEPSLQFQEIKQYFMRSNFQFSKPSQPLKVFGRSFSLEEEQTVASRPVLPQAKPIGRPADRFSQLLDRDQVLQPSKWRERVVQAVFANQNNSLCASELKKQYGTKTLSRQQVEAWAERVQQQHKKCGGPGICKHLLRVYQRETAQPEKKQVLRLRKQVFDRVG